MRWPIVARFSVAMTTPSGVEMARVVVPVLAVAGPSARAGLTLGSGSDGEREGVSPRSEKESMGLPENRSLKGTAHVWPAAAYEPFAGRTSCWGQGGRLPKPQG